jgi:hypothetical protein
VELELINESRARLTYIRLGYILHPSRMYAEAW